MSEGCLKVARDFIESPVDGVLLTLLSESILLRRTPTIHNHNHHHHRCRHHDNTLTSRTIARYRVHLDEAIAQAKSSDLPTLRHNPPSDHPGTRTTPLPRLAKVPIYEVWRLLHLATINKKLAHRIFEPEVKAKTHTNANQEDKREATSHVPLSDNHLRQPTQQEDATMPAPPYHHSDDDIDDDDFVAPANPQGGDKLTCFKGPLLAGWPVSWAEVVVDPEDPLRWRKVWAQDSEHDIMKFYKDQGIKEVAKKMEVDGYDRCFTPGQAFLPPHPENKKFMDDPWVVVKHNTNGDIRSVPTSKLADWRVEGCGLHQRNKGPTLTDGQDDRPCEHFRDLTGAPKLPYEKTRGFFEKEIAFSNAEAGNQDWEPKKDICGRPIPENSPLVAETFGRKSELNELHSATSAGHVHIYQRPIRVGAGWGNYDRVSHWTSSGRKVTSDMLPSEAWSSDDCREEQFYDKHDGPDGEPATLTVPVWDSKREGPSMERPGKYARKTLNSQVK
ncbi:hypothetical protein F4780DRAFT_779279 [Xylariomycetidae sp. FL0641]|nr:hypothetical protein F4780DRAFT_779279 [Xylariomycetidae sp. FL0641]